MITTNVAHSLCSSAKGSLLQGAGVPLDFLTRSFMESRFGLLLGNVRVHTGPWAAAAARALGSRAFTLGHDIVFGEGQYAPESVEGQRLLAHELVHVVQQRGAFLPTNHSGVTVGDRRDPLEAEAVRVADEVFGGGPISSIHRDMAPAIRRVIQVDAASATLTVDPGVSRARPTVEIATFGTRKVAVAHLTEGVNVANAAATGSPIVDPVIKMIGKFDVLTDPNDDVTLPGFKFGFIQIGNVIVLEDTYVGRTINEGHIKLKHRLKVSPTVLLDSVTSFNPFSSRAATSAVETRGPKKVTHFTVDLGAFPNKKGDSPHGFSSAVIINRDTSAENFLFEYRADAGFTTVLVVIDPQKSVQALSHVNWHLVWHSQFKWRGAQNPTATAIPINNRSDFGPVIKGAPTNSAVAALVANPIGPFFNDVVDAAKKGTALGQRPNREDNFSRPTGVPADFFT